MAAVVQAPLHIDRLQTHRKGLSMDNNTMKIGTKTVQLSQPYRATVGEIVGRDEEMKKILASWMGVHDSLPLAPVLVGEPGLGKNIMVYEGTRIRGQDLYIFQGHEDVTAEDLICAVRFSDDPRKKMDYILSPLVSAAVRGAVCFVDEIAKIRTRALAPLASLLDERRYIDSTLLGERPILKRRSCCLSKAKMPLRPPIPGQTAGSAGSSWAMFMIFGKRRRS
jgi:hypothetical protein